MHLQGWKSWRYLSISDLGYPPRPPSCLIGPLSLKYPNTARLEEFFIVHDPLPQTWYSPSELEFPNSCWSQSREMWLLPHSTNESPSLSAKEGLYHRRSSFKLQNTSRPHKTTLFLRCEQLFQSPPCLQGDFLKERKVVNNHNRTEACYRPVR